MVVIVKCTIPFIEISVSCECVNLRISLNKPYCPCGYDTAAVGAKVPTSCSFRHVSVLLAEDGDWKDNGWAGKLARCGYRGDRPSVWAMQVRNFFVENT